MNDKQDIESLEEAMLAAGEAGDYAEAERLKKKINRLKERQAKNPTPAPGASTRQSEGAARARRAVARDAAAEAAKKRLTTVAGACIAVAIASVAVSAWMFAKSSDALNRVEGNLVKAVVATRDIPSGTILSDADLEIGSVPRDFSPTDAADKLEDLVGKKTITDQTKGMAVPASSVAGSHDPASLPAAITEGYVGMMISLEPANALSPLSSVGDKVDVLGGASDGVVASTALLAENVRIIALDSNLSEGPSEGYQYVTVEVTRDQALAIASSQSVRLIARPLETEAANAE